MNVDEWIKNKYKNEFNDVTNDFLINSPIRQINDLDDLILYLDWDYRASSEYSTECTLANEFINYKNYQNSNT